MLIRDMTDSQHEVVVFGAWFECPASKVVRAKAASSLQTRENTSGTNSFSDSVSGDFCAY